MFLAVSSQFAIQSFDRPVTSAGARFECGTINDRKDECRRFTPESGHRALAILRLTTSHSLQMGSSDHRDDRVAFDCIIWEDFN
jgi:hypothetical protein